MPASPALYVGLGNPGKDYQDTRHNLGFACIDLIAHRWDARFSRSNRFSACTARAEGNAHLLKPDTFVNASGTAVGAMARFYNIEAEQVVVIHDDLDLEPGMVRLKMGGGHGGHNGLKDIINHLKTKDFWRIRLGIGHPGNKDMVTPYVLGKAPAEEQELHRQAMARVVDNIDDIAAGNMAKVQEVLHSNGI